MRPHFWLLVPFLMVGCKSPAEKPPDVMSAAEMTEFLVELHLIQASVQNMGIRADSAQQLFLLTERKLLKDFQLQDSVFYKSYSWYLQNPDQMYDIYTAVVDSLTLRESLIRTD